MIAKFLPISLLLLSTTTVRAQETVNVIQPGDQAMSCKALGAEINMLTRGQVKRQQKAAARANGGGFGGALGKLGAFARPVLNRVVSETHGSTMAAAVTARDTLDEVQSTAARTPQPASRPAPAAPTVEDLRLKRLNEIHAAKRC